MCDIFGFFEFNMRTCSFGKKNKTDQWLYYDNINQFQQLTRDHVWTLKQF